MTSSIVYTDTYTLPAAPNDPEYRKRFLASSKKIIGELGIDITAKLNGNDLSYSATDLEHFTQFQLMIHGDAPLPRDIAVPRNEYVLTSASQSAHFDKTSAARALLNRFDVTEGSDYIITNSPDGKTSTFRFDRLSQKHTLWMLDAKGNLDNIIPEPPKGRAGAAASPPPGGWPN